MKQLNCCSVRVYDISCINYHVISTKYAATVCFMDNENYDEIVSQSLAKNHQQ